VKNAFFARGPNPAFSYTLRPVLSADSQQSIELQIDGQTHTFSRNSLMQHPYTWPAPAGVKAAASGNNRVSTASSTGFSAHSGLWAVFRMLADAEPRALNQKSVEWKKTRSASGDLQTFEPSVRLEFVEFPGGVDIFNSKAFEGIRCPTKPVQ
jgi:type VI protein secretion system component VasK